MTSLPDWLVERAALDEVAPASRDRVERADPQELAERIAALRADNAAELAAHPAGPAVAQIEARIAAESKQRRASRRRLLGLAGVMVGAVAAVVFIVKLQAPVTREGSSEALDEVETTRVKGASRLLAFRHTGDQVERLDADTLVRAGDVIQLRYSAGGRSHGVIASVDGAGGVTLHYPVSEDAPPEATALSAKTTALPHAYALDDAPRFERFFFITADGPIDIKHSLAALHALAHRADSATAPLELPTGLRQWSLRLRKPTNDKSPTP